MLEELIIRIMGHAVAQRIFGRRSTNTTTNTQQRRGCWDRWGRWGCAIVLGIVVTIIAAFWAIAFGIVVAVTYTGLSLYTGLKFLATNAFIALDKLFYPGFEAPTVVVWGLWGLVGGAAIQGCRELLNYGRKGMGILVVVLAPVILFVLTGIVKNNISVPNTSDIKPITTVEQKTSRPETEPIKTTKPTPSATEQTTTEPEKKPVKTTTRREPVQTTKRKDTAPVKPTEPTRVTTKQNTVTTPPVAPKPSTLSVPVGMVLIPAGEFQMGSTDNADEKPVHTVYTDAFYMDKYEVTNAQYKVFIDANPQWRKDRIPTKYHDGDYLKHWNGNNYPSGKGNHPVNYVSWYGAMAYAKWAGKRLPTEAEWEKAARGGLVSKKYPWGNDIDPTKANYDKNVGNTRFVGWYGANDYGLYDMAGNVLEWCLDRYDENFYGTASRQNPIAGGNIKGITGNFLNSTATRVLRGGSWSVLAQNVRVADRTKGNPTLSYFGLGFRCVRAVPQSDRD